MAFVGVDLRLWGRRQDVVEPRAVRARPHRRRPFVSDVRVPRYYRQHGCFPPPVKGKPNAVSPAADPPAVNAPVDEDTVPTLRRRVHHVSEVAAIKLQAAEDRTDAAMARAIAAEAREIAAEARAEAEKKERLEEKAKWEKRWEDERERGEREATRWRRMYEEERARASAQKEIKARRTSE